MALPEIFEGLTHSIADSEETIPGKGVARIAALEMREVRALCDAGILAFGFERGTSETRKKFLKWQAEELGSCLRGAVYATQLETKLGLRSEEHTSELQSLMRISYAVFCLKKKTI